MPGTAVLMADGSAKPIDKIEVGDKVLATDPTTGKTAPQPVLATITRTGAKHLVQLTIDTDGDHGDKTGALIATDNHPFWVPTAGKWIDAGKLKPGMWLRTSAGTHIQLTATKTWTQHQRVHNLTIATDHTYYVRAGSVSVLVHNRTCSPELAEYAKSLPRNSPDIHVISRLTTRMNPRGYFAHNMNREIWDVDFDARQAIDRAGGHHMGCAEIGCISDAYEAWDPMEDAVMEAVHFAPGTPYHLTPVSPCPDACEPLLPKMGILPLE